MVAPISIRWLTNYKPYKICFDFSSHTKYVRRESIATKNITIYRPSDYCRTCDKKSSIDTDMFSDGSRSHGDDEYVGRSRFPSRSLDASRNGPRQYEPSHGSRWHQSRSFGHGSQCPSSCCGRCRWCMQWWSHEPRNVGRAFYSSSFRAGPFNNILMSLQRGELATRVGDPDVIYLSAWLCNQTFWERSSGPILARRKISNLNLTLFYSTPFFDGLSNFSVTKYCERGAKRTIFVRTQTICLCSQYSWTQMDFVRSRTGWTSTHFSAIWDSERDYVHERGKNVMPTNQVQFFHLCSILPSSPTN